MSYQKLSPALIRSFKDALVDVFWYKPDLKNFLIDCDVSSSLIAQAAWEDPNTTKRTIIQQIVHTLSSNPQRYGDQLLRLVMSVYDIEDPVHLKRIKNDGERLYERSVTSLDAFKKQAKPLADLRKEQRDIQKRRIRQQEIRDRHADLNKALDRLNLEFKTIVDEQSAQKRGYKLERFLPDLFHLFDIDARGSFKIQGEQIDGAFHLGDVEYIVEAKWHKKPTPRMDLVYFSDKITTKLDTTLGLFISMNGFEPSAITNGNSKRPNMILMDGGDLTAVLEHRIGLPQLINGKRQHASQTGEIMISAYRLI
jgi:hypothetical protein